MGKTSNAVKQKYNARVYKQVNTQLKRELVEVWEDTLKCDGISKADFIRTAITSYLDKKNVPYCEKPGE